MARASQLAVMEAAGWRMVDQPAALTINEETYYLRSTPLVAWDASLRDEAAQIAQVDPGASCPLTPEAQVEALIRMVAYLSSDVFAYEHPCLRRGTRVMRENRRGDCGEYSFLLAAWCRALDIPARVVIGTWAIGRLQAHAWNEVFVRGVGWVPVDATVAAWWRGQGGVLPKMAATLRGLRPRHHEEPLSLLGVDGPRLALSLEADPHPLPEYAGWHKPPDTGLVLELGGHRTAWGYQLVEGNVPYLQPAYPLFHDATPAPDGQSLGGEWSSPLTPRQRVYLLVRLSGLGTLLSGLVLALLGLVGWVSPSTSIVLVCVLVGLTLWTAGIDLPGPVHWVSRSIAVSLAAVLAYYVVTTWRGP